LSYRPSLFRFPVNDMLVTTRTEFFDLKTPRLGLFIFVRFVISVFALAAFQVNNYTHERGFSYSIISATTPAPTVRPPSRIAKRSSFSMAISLISSTSTEMLSPGITISTPSGSLMEPVTSVVRK